MSTTQVAAIISLQGALGALDLPPGTVASLNQGATVYQGTPPEEQDKLFALGVSLEGVTHLWPFSYDGLAVFMKWNGNTSKLEVYALGGTSEGGLYLLSTFKSLTPTSYKLDPKTMVVQKVLSAPAF